jgi:hypothetical protein
MEAADSFKEAALIKQTTWHHKPRKLEVQFTVLFFSVLSARI